jgi:hypothetical protein
MRFWHRLKIYSIHVSVSSLINFNFTTILHTDINGRLGGIPSYLLGPGFKSRTLDELS